MIKKIAILLSAFGIIILDGCGKTNLDPQELLREALENSFSIESSAEDANLEIEIENVEEVNGTMKIVVSGKTENILTFPQKIDYSIDVNFDLHGAGENLTGSVGLGCKMLKDAFFAKINELELTSNNPELETSKTAIEAFAKQWWRISLKDFGISELAESQNEQFENYKKLFVENDILFVENSSENEENYILSVVPNFDLIFTKDFIENEILASAKTGIENNPNFSAEEKENLLAEQLELGNELLTELPKIRENAKQIWKAGNFRLVVEIGKNDKFIYSSEMSGELDLAELGKIFDDEGMIGKIIFNFTSTLSEINQPQNITAPEEFTEFDPTMIFGMQVSPDGGDYWEDEDWQDEDWDRDHENMEKLDNPIDKNKPIRRLQ